MLSSLISGVAKFEPISIKVGKLPVVRPFNRCNVVVGGSARNLNRRLRAESFLSNSSKIVILFSYGNGSSVFGFLIPNSYFKASTTNMTTLAFFGRQSVEVAFTSLKISLTIS